MFNGPKGLTKKVWKKTGKNLKGEHGRKKGKYDYFVLMINMSQNDCKKKFGKNREYF